jgi:Tfp pilus assembly protein PilN
VFVYENMLTTTQQAKKADVVQKQKDLQVETVEEFVRLQNRLTTSAALLDAHPAYSKFFSALETMIPATVRFTSLNISRDEAGVPKITASGLAKSFNALASASDALASDNRLKDAIFSGISINSNGSVSFSLTATLDPKIIAFTQDAPVEPSVQEEATPEEPPLEELP